ncbi:FAD-dependent oxidoreductase [uncultured Streptomyces sp.]|uniref:FAD-dependent oxidoreductase n=1 Tax=uncultured Streptomyces sp. TaxID=174707 RepID=UPI0026122A1C|nr:FAD-dependent oxidoreductase [uncultured Streptomyces sp.]
MLSSARHADVVIIGAGVAGLSAAHRLIGAGVSCTVLEAAGHVGGRLGTRTLDGFRLDLLGPLLSPQPGGAPLAPGLEALELREFASGVLVHSGGRRHPVGPFRGARGAFRAVRARPGALHPFPAHRGAAVVGALDQARLGAALARLAATPPDRLWSRPERAAAELSAARGLPARTVGGVLHPLLTALLSDPELVSSGRCADLVLRDYARGGLAVPAGGAAALPELLAAALPAGTVRTGVHVTGAGINRVVTKDHGELDCRSLLLATGAGAAAELLPGLRVPDFHPVTVVHHAAPAPPPGGSSLLLDADRSGPVAYTAVMSEVDPSRAPEGRALVTSTLLGAPPQHLDRAVRTQLASLYGTDTGGWELLAVHHDREAVPVMRPPHDPRRPVRILSGLYVCGDHRDTSTVRGALRSGRRAASWILRDLGVREAEPSYTGVA